jgi:nicotinamidase-related amidase
MAKKKALLVIDMLNDFVQAGAPLEVPGARNIISNIKKKIEEARREKTPVIYLCDAHAPDDPEFRVWPKHAVRGSYGAAVTHELKPGKKDAIILKTTYSGFFGTRLDRLLKKIRPKQLIATGVCTEICVLYTVADAYMRGYEVDVPEECVSGLTKEDHEFALKQMKYVLKPYQRPCGRRRKKG